MRSVVFVALVMATLGCGRTQMDQPADAGSPPADADGSPPAGADGSRLADAPVDSPGEARDASGVDVDARSGDLGSTCGGTVVRNPTTVSTIPPFCGGQVDVAGPSPFGPFVADALLTRVGADDCNGEILLNLYTGPVTVAAQIPDGLELSFSLRYDNTRSTWLGTHSVMGGLARTDRSATMAVPIAVDVTAMDDPYGGDADQGPLPTPPPGQYRLTIDVDTGCGHITGTIVAPYCGWAACI